MKKVRAIISALFISLVFIKPAYADFNVLREITEKIGNSHPEFQKAVIETKTLVSKTKQLATRVKQTVDNVKKTIKQAENAVEGVVSDVEKSVKVVKGAVEKTQELVSTAKTAAQTIKSGKVPTNLSLNEFKALAFISNGDISRPDDVKAEKTKEFFLKNPDKDDIEYQRQKEKAVNQRNANQSADQYSESLVVRQEIAAEKDDPQTPETIDEAQKLIQENSQKSHKRNNQIVKMKAMQLDYAATSALMGLNNQTKQEPEDAKDEN